MSKKRFKIELSGDNKRIFVEGKGFPLSLEINNDDVDHERVKDDTEKLLAILEEHWK